MTVLLVIGYKWMIIPFEAKYIQVHWINKNTVDYIYESRDAIEIQKIDNSSYKVEAITYSKIEKNKSGQLAFRVLNDTYKSGICTGCFDGNYACSEKYLL